MLYHLLGSRDKQVGKLALTLRPDAKNVDQRSDWRAGTDCGAGHTSSPNQDHGVLCGVG
jgi:hypothetical protein